MIFSPYLNNAISVLLTFTRAAFSISLLFCSSSSFFVGLLKFLSSTGFSESFSFQSRSLSVSTLQFNFDFLLKIQKGGKVQNYDKSKTNPLNFFKSKTSTGKNTGPSPLSLVGVSFNKAVCICKIFIAEPRKNSEFLSTLWRSGYRAQIEPGLQRDSVQSNTTGNVHCHCPTFKRLSRRFDIGVRFRFKLGGDVSSAIVA